MQRAIAAGDAEAGCTVHIVTDELDDGEVLGQARVPILPGDTPKRSPRACWSKSIAFTRGVLAEFAAR